ncbi:MAG: hypothetical protein FWG02_11145 [Holophagaceae bacterium]|nr:hypothetical protein [Holophagaceae bacterium]
MLIRTALSCLTLPAALYAQQNNIAFEVYSGDFPANYAFKIDMKVKYSVINTQKIVAENRKSPVPNDHILAQLSDNMHGWDITYDTKGVPEIKGSPRAVTFTFSTQLREFNNAMAVLKLEGMVTVLKDGKTYEVIPFRQNRPFKSGVKYVLMVSDYSRETGTVKPAFLFLTSDELQKVLQGRPQGNQMPFKAHTAVKR